MAGFNCSTRLWQVLLRRGKRTWCFRPFGSLGNVQRTIIRYIPALRVNDVSLGHEFQPESVVNRVWIGPLLASIGHCPLNRPALPAVVQNGIVPLTSVSHIATYLHYNRFTRLSAFSLVRHQVLWLDPEAGLLQGSNNEILLRHTLLEGPLRKLTVEVFRYFQSQ